MEINNFISTSHIYQQTALKKTELQSVEKQSFEKSTQEQNDLVNESDTSAKQEEYAEVLNRNKAEINNSAQLNKVFLSSL